MHVVLLNHAYGTLPPERADSAGLVLHHLATGLAEVGLEVTALGCPSGAPLSYRVEPVCAPNHRIYARSAIVREIGYAIASTRRLGKMRPRPDIVHCVMTTPGAAATVIADVPVVFTYNTPIGASGRVAGPGLAGRASPYLERIACSGADAVIALASRSAQFLEGEFSVPAERIHVIPNGVDTGLFHPAPDPAPGNLLDVLIVARIAAYKDHETAIRAFVDVSSAHPAARLLLAGPVTDTRLATYLRSLAGPVSDRVVWLGEVAPAMLPELYRQAAVVLAPSRAEGLPLALLEAMSSARAVVASSIPQHLEVAGGFDSGVAFFSPGDSRELHERLTHLLADASLRADAGRRARARVEDRYSWRSVAERTRDLYESLLRVRSGPSH